MTFERSEIKEGVFLSAVKTDKFKTNLLTVNLLVPLLAKTASLNSLLTDVIKRGTVNYPTMQSLNKKQEELYSLGLASYVQKRGEAQVVVFELSAIDDNYTFDKTNLLEQSLALLGEMIFSPVTENGVFVADYVAQEKKNLIDSIKAQINNKNSYAITRCHEVMCADEPFSVNAAGDIATVEKITPEQLYAQYQTLLDTATVEVLYVGSMEPSYIAGLVNKYLPFAERKPAAIETFVKTTSGEVKYHTDKMQINQCKLSIGLRTGITLKDKDYIKFALFNELFGGSTSSKLFVNVREKKSLCYYCRPVVEGIKGVMVIASGVDMKNKDIAYQAIMEQLEEVKNGVISDQELSDARKSLENAYREITDSPASICSWYLSRIITGRTDSPEEAAKLLATVTKQDITDVSKKLVLDTVYSLEA
jgi:predicted Zn-dependent peptidase